MSFPWVNAWAPTALFKLTDSLSVCSRTSLKSKPSDCDISLWVRFGSLLPFPLEDCNLAAMPAGA